MSKINSNSVFKERYKSLNKEQKQAVDTIDGPVLVVAGPGTGKTTILTLRIAEILQKTDTPPNGILAITYTNAGVKAMREKLREVIGNTAHDVSIHTFHSFASAMISEYPSHFIEIGDFRQMTDVEVESLIRKIIIDPKFKDLRPLGRPDANLYSIIRAMSDSKKDALTPEAVKEFALKEIKRVKEDEENISTRGATKGQLKAVALDKLEKLEKTILFSEVYKIYEEEKKKNKLRDYDDLIIELLIKLRTDELFLRLVQERFLYILVDEHQDTNDAQNFIVGMIAEFFKTPNIFVVGDEKQAIYRFQGASVENFLRLRKIWPDMKIISLDTNYRSHQAILDASFSMIENNYQEGEHLDLRIKLKSGNGSKSKPLDIISSENTLAMEDYLVKELKKIISDEPKSKVAIITRRNKELERILSLLEGEGIPVSSERSVDIFHHPVGVVFFDLLEYLTDPTSYDLLARTVAVGLWKLKLQDSIELIRKIRKNELDIDNDLPTLNRIRERVLKDGAVSAIIDIANDSGFISLVIRDPSYVNVWRGIVTLAESIERDAQIDNPLELIRSMLEYKLSAESKSVKVSVGAPDLQIKAMTAHGSKGLEFDYVFIPYANEESWVGKVWGSSFVLPEKNSNNHNVPDVRRLFYVAITRARKHTTILYALEESDGKTMTPLRFINELNSDSIKTHTIPKLDLVLKEKESINKGDEFQELMTSQAKKVLHDSGLSVTALNHFIECPNKFLYESILKLPQGPTVSAEKGLAMHLAISNVWNLKEKTIANIENTISNTITEYIDKTLLSKNDKEALKKELLEDAPDVAKELLPHFTTELSISTEKWIEIPFSTKYNDEEITIPLHGKLDSILSSIDVARVFDYKTKQAMTERAIRGETSNEDGNYFRQLVFYKLLLQNDYSFRNKKINTSLVFVSPDDKGRCPTVTLEVLLGEIKVVEEEIRDLIQVVWSGDIARKYCDDKNCQYCGYRKLMSNSI
jgi:DNA helicase II / ATP-dependent DNA helicase PcrA